MNYVNNAYLVPIRIGIVLLRLRFNPILVGGQEIREVLAYVHSAGTIVPHRVVPMAVYEIRG